MNRLAAIVVVLLIGGTAAAFAYTQGLKQTKSPIVGTKVRPHEFSPVCACPTRFLHIAFGLRRNDNVSILIVNSHGDVVRTLVVNRIVRKGYRGFTWDGQGDDGRRVPDGVYKARVDLADADRTIDLPNQIRVDTTPPRIIGAAPQRTRTSILVRYRVDGQAHGLLFVGGRRVQKTYGYKPVGKLEVSLAYLRSHGFSGRVAVGAEDLAGNVSKLRVLKLSVPR